MGLCHTASPVSRRSRDAKFTRGRRGTRLSAIEYGLAETGSLMYHSAESVYPPRQTHADF